MQHPEFPKTISNSDQRTYGFFFEWWSFNLHFWMHGVDRQWFLEAFLSQCGNFHDRIILVLVHFHLKTWSFQASKIDFWPLSLRAEISPGSLNLLIYYILFMTQYSKSSHFYTVGHYSVIVPLPVDAVFCGLVNLCLSKMPFL